MLQKVTVPSSDFTGDALLVTKIIKRDKDWQGVFLLSSTGHWTRYLTADPIWLGRKSCQYNYISGQDYSCTGMTFCPWSAASLMASWRHQKKTSLPIFIPFNDLWLVPWWIALMDRTWKPLQHNCMRGFGLTKDAGYFDTVWGGEDAVPALPPAHAGRLVQQLCTVGSSFTCIVLHFNKRDSLKRDLSSSYICYQTTF